jgi:hypothetical protein
MADLTSGQPKSERLAVNPVLGNSANGWGNVWRMVRGTIRACFVPESAADLHRQPLPTAEQIGPHLSQGCHLAFYPVNLRSNRRREGRFRGVPTKRPKRVSQTLLRFRADIPISPLPLEFSNELTSRGHPQGKSKPIYRFGHNLKPLLETHDASASI